ncbi:MAG: triphosphoribosyl-dephospho-CoA synthase, partial [Planctomycetia bacterium]|nr:triphosphoribosyl-dephospho-CoA synthase [Planctomycetia bacterium]
MAALAGVLEASAPKPGNVHPGAAFNDLCYEELVAAARSMA